MTSNDGLREVLDVLRWAKTSTTSDASKIRIIMDAFARCAEKVRTAKDTEEMPEGWVLAAFLRSLEKMPDGNVRIAHQSLTNWSYEQALALVPIEHKELEDGRRY